MPMISPILLLYGKVFLHIASYFSVFSIVVLCTFLKQGCAYDDVSDGSRWKYQQSFCHDVVITKQIKQNHMVASCNRLF